MCSILNGTQDNNFENPNVDMVVVFNNKPSVREMKLPLSRPVLQSAMTEKKQIFKWCNRTY